MTRFSTLSRSQVLYVFLVVLVVLPVLVGLVFQTQLYDLWVVSFVGPELQRHFGFRAGRVEVVAAGGHRLEFAVTAVNPSGAFARAGVKPFDLPIGYQHGIASGFYQHLMWAREGHPADIMVLAASDYSKRWQSARRIRIEAPSAK